MGTIAVIARPTGPDTFTGIYVGGDGYPQATGRCLWKQVITHFHGDLEAAARYYIDDHPRGWYRLDEAFGRNECYCHDRGEGTDGRPMLSTQDQISDVDYTYVLMPEYLKIYRFGRPRKKRVTWDPEQRVNWEGIDQYLIDHN
ncbi:hypothetical protein ACFPC0_11190 [Streptomyces andamanensis]|uniref:Uncharacterized protein n=1 Tax=Streptomyces andamanensis TaxID=1565035 RepID=A0ABV8TCQ7_9ACTN